MNIYIYSSHYNLGDEGAAVKEKIVPRLYN